MNKYGSCIRAAKKIFQNAAGFVYFVLIANGWAYQVLLVHGSARREQRSSFKHIGGSVAAREIICMISTIIWGR